MSKLSVALIQMSYGADVKKNIGKNSRAVRDAAARGAGLVVLPELHNSLYFCQSEDSGNFDLAEAVPGPSTDHYGRLAKELSITLVASIFEKRAAGLYHNTAVVFGPAGEICGTYRKMHIPDDPQFYEKYYFAPGDSGFFPIDAGAKKIGVMVCWDQWYPEPARLMAIHGAQMLVYPSAIGWEPSDASDEKKRQLDSWVTIQRSHAVANGIPVIAVNRTGFEANPQKTGSAGIQFWGNSFAAGSQGEILAQAANDREEILMVDLDLSATERQRRVWPFLRDRRIDAYGDLIKRYGDA